MQGFDPAEAERRAKHMREQRDRLVAMKKAEREKKVQAEEERNAKARSDGDKKPPAAVAELLSNTSSVTGGEGDAKRSGAVAAQAAAEERRSSLRNALARRMKMDLMEKEEEKFAQAQDDQFSALDQRLHQVEQTREDNRRREYILAKQVERQKALIAKNVQASAASLARSDGFDA